MKYKKWIPIIGLFVLLAVLFVPLPQDSLDDGGTREYVALTYRIVHWNRVHPDGLYEKTRFYFGSDRNKSINELWEQEYFHVEERFIATVLEINNGSILVEPIEGEPERLSSDRISLDISNLEKIDVYVGIAVQISYTGGIMESYPAQINATGWKLSDDLRHLEYTDPWLDKNTAEKYDDNVLDHFIITRIYSNCFFARKVIPMPYEIKLNGTLAEEWCVGDQVACTYNNTHYDHENKRMEVDVLKVEESNWQPDPNVAYKPVIYLYPPQKTEVMVNLNLDGNLICTYPKYNNGWNVTADSDGTLTDLNGQSYNYLYWEGQINTQYDFSKGFCVKGADTAEFLENVLPQLGLNRREANEFIVYWLPLMENNPYNIISFQSEAYTNAAELNVSPSPDSVIRVFMTWYSSEQFVEIAPPIFDAPVRTGFTLVEWGGTEINP